MRMRREYEDRYAAEPPALNPAARAQPLGDQLALVYRHGKPDPLSADVTRQGVERALHVFESPFRVRPTSIFFYQEDGSIKFHPYVIAQTEKNPAAPAFCQQRPRRSLGPESDKHIDQDGYIVGRHPVSGMFGRPRRADRATGAGDIARRHSCDALRTTGRSSTTGNGLRMRRGRRPRASILYDERSGRCSKGSGRRYVDSFTTT